MHAGLYSPRTGNERPSSEHGSVIRTHRVATLPNKPVMAAGVFVLSHRLVSVYFALCNQELRMCRGVDELGTQHRQHV